MGKQITQAEETIPNTPCALGAIPGSPHPIFVDKPLQIVFP